MIRRMFRVAPTVALVLTAVACLSGATCKAAVRIDAYRGEPFGVGRITIDLPQDESAAPGGDDRFAVADEAGRVVYPVQEQRRIGKLLRDLLGVELPNRATFYFLFRGDEPLNLIVYAPDAQRFTVTPEQKPREFQRRFDDWWKDVYEPLRSGRSRCRVPDRGRELSHRQLGPPPRPRHA